MAYPAGKGKEREGYAYNIGRTKEHRRYTGGTPEVLPCYHRLGIEMVQTWYRDGMDLQIYVTT